MNDRKNYKVEALQYEADADDMTVRASFITASRGDAMRWAFQQMELGYWTVLYLTDEREQRHG